MRSDDDVIVGLVMAEAVVDDDAMRRALDRGHSAAVILRPVSAGGVEGALTANRARLLAVPLDRSLPLSEHGLGSRETEI